MAVIGTLLRTTGGNLDLGVLCRFFQMAGGEKIVTVVVPTVEPNFVNLVQRVEQKAA